MQNFTHQERQRPGNFSGIISNPLVPTVSTSSHLEDLITLDNNLLDVEPSRPTEFEEEEEQEDPLYMLDDDLQSNSDPLTSQSSCQLDTECLFCSQTPRNTQLKPCGHIVGCELCSLALKKCLFCQSAILERVPIRECIICSSKLAQVTLEPCGHMICCGDCDQMVKVKCTLCRSVIHSRRPWKELCRIDEKISNVKDTQPNNLVASKNNNVLIANSVNSTIGSDLVVVRNNNQPVSLPRNCDSAIMMMHKNSSGMVSVDFGCVCVEALAC